MNNILTFNELKEIAKKIAMDDDRVEKLYIEQLETQSMSSDVNFFNVLYLVKDLSFDEMKATLAEKAAEDAVKKDTTIVSKALKKLFEEYNVKSSNSDVDAYIKSMLEGSSTEQ